jgi:hypothetical protein
MTTHKWLPEQPTDEIIEAWFSNHEKGFEKAYKAMWQSAPEVEQEPVGEIYEQQHDGSYRAEMVVELPVGTKIYTHPQQTREPLSDKELSELYLSLPLSTREDVCSYSFKKGFRQAEKAHGIGVE